MDGMKLGWGLAFALVACGDGNSSKNGQTDSDSGTGTDGATTQGSSPTEEGSQSASETENHSGVSESITGETTASDTTEGVSITGSEPTTTTLTTVTTLDTTADDTSDTSDTTTTVDPSVGESDTSTGTTADSSDDTTTTGDTSTTEPDCVPSPEICNDLDDDCNNIIDDLDVGMDGVCDCLSIALVGNEGANPSSEFQAYLQDLGTTTDRINSVVMNDINVPLTAEVLAEYDILIVDWLQRMYTPEEAKAVREWVEAGGGLMTMTGHTNNQTVIDRPNSIIAPMGLSYNGSAGFFSGPVTQFAVHPITQGLTSLTFAGGLFINIMNNDMVTNTTIMTLPPGPVGVVQQRSMGRLFVFGDEWVEFDSQWMNMPDIKQFWVQTLAYLGPQDSCIVPQ